MTSRPWCAFAAAQGIGLTIVGPEAPLVAGVTDAFEAAGLRCLGPRQAAAQLEGSKAFTKAFLARHGIPTAAYGTFSEVGPALDYLRQVGAPVVVKADGLAAGKGVILAQDLATAEAAVRDMLEAGRFGGAGPAPGHRGIPLRRGGEFHRPGGRRSHPAHGQFPGPQGAGRRRPRAQHRGHGGLLAGTRW